MTESTLVPFYRSFLLNRVVYLNEVDKLTDEELNMLNIDTLAALNEARHKYELLENKQSDDAKGEYRRMKMANYFQAAIQLELESQSN